MPAKTPADRLADLQQPGRLFSHSALSVFQDCPHAYFGSYILGVEAPPSAPLVQGRLVHTAATQLIRGALDAPAVAIAYARSVEESAALVAPDRDPQFAEWAAAAAEAVPPFSERVESESVWLQPMPAGPTPPPPFPDVAPAEAALAADEPYAFFRAQDVLQAARVDGVQARPDLVMHIPGGLPIRDWKTSRVPDVGGLPALVARYRDQLALYGAAARRRFPGATLSFDLQLFTAATVVEVPLTASDLDAASRRVFTTAQAIKQAAAQGFAGFPKRVGDACRYCPLAIAQRGTEAVCPEGAAHRRLQGWDRWDARERERRQAAGFFWAYDPPA